MVKILQKAVEAAAKAEQRNRPASVLSDDDITKTPGGDLLVKAMPEDDLKALNDELADLGSPAGLNLGRIGEIFGETDMFGDNALENILSNIKTNNKEVFEYLRRDKQSMESMLAIATETGYDRIIHSFLTRKPGQVAPPDDVLAGVVALIKLGQETQYGARQVLGMADGPEKTEAFKKVRLLATVTSNLAAQVSGNVSEFARGLSVVSNISKLENMNLGNYAEQLDTFINQMDDGLIDFHMHTLVNLQSPTAKAKYAEKGLLAKTYDVAMESYINALLSSPVTHMVNMAGNFGFQVQTLAERGLAGVIGEVRTATARALGMDMDIGDQRYIGEAAAEAHGLKMAQKDALVLMTKTFLTGEGSEAISKIDLRTRRAVGSTDNVADIGRAINQGDFTKASIDSLGIMLRLSGRFLATEDEYFKVISRRRVLYREAHRSGQIVYQNARKSGMSRDDAKAMAEAKYYDTIANPSKEIEDIMTAEARQLTFQQKPEGFFGRMGPTLNSIPFIKTVVPFYNTPTNIINEVFDRTLNIYSVYRAIKHGKGKDFDDAVAKLSLGNSVAGAMFALANGDYGDDIIVTGNLSRDFSTKINIQGSANVPPSSIGFKQDDGSYKFYTFSRFDPLSATLTMGADLANYMKYEDDPDVIDGLLKNYVLAVTEYAQQMPYLQGISELVAAAGGVYQSKEDFAERLMKFSGTQVGNVGTNVLGNFDRSTFGLLSYTAEMADMPFISQTAFTAMQERINNPLASNTKLPAGVDRFDNLYTETPAFMRGFYESLQKAKSRNPSLSGELEDGLNFWAESKTQGQGKDYERYFPIRIQSGEYTALDQELIRLAEVGAGSFPFHKTRIDGILLNDQQYNKYIRLTNAVDEEGRQLGDTLFKGNLLTSLQDRITETEYNLMSDEERFEDLSGILSKHRQQARKILKAEDPRFSLIDMSNQ